MIYKKKKISCKIYKYIYSNPKCIIYLRNIFDNDCYKYKKLVLKCSHKNLKIWNYIDLNDYFLDKILQVRLNYKNICKYVNNNNISENCILNNIQKYLSIINYYEIKSEQFMIKIIFKLVYYQSLLIPFINKINFNHFHKNNHFLRSYNIIKILIQSNPCYFTNMYLSIYFYNLDGITLNHICNILTNVSCGCCILLFNPFIYNINKNDLLLMIQCNEKVLFEYQEDTLLETYGGKDFVKECISSNPLAIIYFKNKYFSYKELLLCETYILEYIQNYEKEIIFKELLIYALNNINKNYRLFISQDTFDYFFYDVSNAYIITSYLNYPKEINTIIHNYLI